MYDCNDNISGTTSAVAEATMLKLVFLSRDIDIAVPSVRPSVTF